LEKLSLAQFEITPTVTVIQPHSKFSFQIEFKPSSVGEYEEVLEVDISDRLPQDRREVILMRLTGECCLPALNNTQWDRIFTSTQRASSLSATETRPIFGETERLLTFGGVMPGEQRSVQFQVENVARIGCQVAIHLTRSNNHRSGGDANSGLKTGTWRVQPEQLVLGPTQSQPVTITFSPHDHGSFHATFEAVIEGQIADPKRKMLTFELSGEGGVASESGSNGHSNGPTGSQAGASRSPPRGRKKPTK
jgi:hypothetical protein